MRIVKRLAGKFPSSVVSSAPLAHARGSEGLMLSRDREGAVAKSYSRRHSNVLRVARYLCFFAAVSYAQEPAASPPQPTFKVESKLVIVNVSVKDKSGNPITTLQKDNFQVLEDGVAQTVSVFELQKLNSDLLSPMSFAATAPRTLQERTPPAGVVTAPTPNSPIRYQDRRLLALFFDLTSMQPGEQVRAREAAIKFLSTQMTASDLVSIMTFSTKLNIVEEFTDDRERLLDTLRKMSLGQGSDLADLAATAADEGDDSGSFVADETEFNIFNTDRKLTALEDAAKKLSIFPEKKALVYFSSGVGKTGVENQSQLKATVNAAVRANVSFYPVDARGLVATPPAGDASTASPRGTGVFTGTKQAGLKATFNDSQETLYSLAADTGGKALLDSNDLTLGIRQAQNDVTSYYILGYYSSNSAEDGKFRRIKVTLTGAPQAKLDYRSGYYGPKTFQKFTASDKEHQLEEALTLGDPVSELPLALEVDYFRVAKDRYFVPISVKIPGSAVGLAKKGANETTDLDFIGQVRDASGKLVSGVRDQINVKLNESDAARISQRHLQYDAGLTLPPGAYSLRFLARENQTGKMGTFETKFTIPDLNGEKTLRLSSVILSSQKEAVSAAVGAADSNKKLLAEHPLVQDGQKVVPSITRVFRKDQTLYVYFEVYDPSLDPDRKAPSVTAELELMSGARKAYTSRPVTLNKLTTTRPGVTPFSFQVPLARFQPGQYVSQVSVIDELGRKFAFPRNSIVLLP
jgi:VWFA-related protein